MKRIRTVEKDERIIVDFSTRLLVFHRIYTMLFSPFYAFFVGLQSNLNCYSFSLVDRTRQPSFI